MPSSLGCPSGAIKISLIVLGLQIGYGAAVKGSLKTLHPIRYVYMWACILKTLIVVYRCHIWQSHNLSIDPIFVMSCLWPRGVV